MGLQQEHVEVVVEEVEVLVEVVEVVEVMGSLQPSYVSMGSDPCHR